MLFIIFEGLFTFKILQKPKLPEVVFLLISLMQMGLASRIYFKDWRIHVQVLKLELEEF